MQCRVDLFGHAVRMRCTRCRLHRWRVLVRAISDCFAFFAGRPRRPRDLPGGHFRLGRTLPQRPISTCISLSEPSTPTGDAIG
jgi:hypothetical protein